MSGRVDDKPVKVGDTPEDMVKFLHQPKDWVVADPKPVTIDGVSGVAVDAVTGPKARGGLLTFPEDAFNTDPKEKIRWIILDKDGKTVVFLLDSLQGNRLRRCQRTDPTGDRQREVGVIN